MDGGVEDPAGQLELLERGDEAIPRVRESSIMASRRAHVSVVPVPECLEGDEGQTGDAPV